MAPHLTASELDLVHQLDQKGKSPSEIHARLAARRQRAGVEVPDLTTLRRAIKGKTHKRGRKETRGRKAKYSKKWVVSLNRARKYLLKKVDNGREVRWKDVVKKARAPAGHRTTVRRAFVRHGVDVAARRPREKPQRTKEHMQERVEYCRRWMRKPSSFFLDTVDMVIDNKTFDLPTTERARRHLAQQHVRFHLRTPSEGLLPQCTRPGQKKNKFNTGAKVAVCAGVSNGRVVLWEYLGSKWNGEAAAELYQGPILKALKKARGIKRSYKVLEDNDPRGFKSGRAVAAKREVKIRTLPFPRYSPDLNPLDFSIWSAIEARMIERAPKTLETVAQYKKRLRATALRLPTQLVSAAVRSMPSRMRAVVDAKGGNISQD